VVFLEIPEILSKLEYNTGNFPSDAIHEAVKQKEEIIPELLKILEYTIENIHKIEEIPNYFAHIYAMFLLAQFREKQAYPLIVELFSFKGDICFNICGDFVTEDLSRVLASVCGGDSTLIKQLIENRDANEFVRSAGIDALMILVIQGIANRDEVKDYYISLFMEKFEKEYSYIWDSLVYHSSVLCPEEAYGPIVMAWEEGLADSFFNSPADLEKNVSIGWERSLFCIQDSIHNQLIDDTVRSMQGWASFKQKTVKPKPTPVKIPGKKVGRNQPCPCGSGIKYKKCCGSLRNVK
jgi:hypothetical protein